MPILPLVAFDMLSLSWVLIVDLPGAAEVYLVGLIVLLGAFIDISYRKAVLDIQFRLVVLFAFLFANMAIWCVIIVCRKVGCEYLLTLCFGLVLFTTIGYVFHKYVYGDSVDDLKNAEKLGLLNREKSSLVMGANTTKSIYRLRRKNKGKILDSLAVIVVLAAVVARATLDHMSENQLALITSIAALLLVFLGGFVTRHLMGICWLASDYERQTHLKLQKSRINRD